MGQAFVGATPTQRDDRYQERINGDKFHLKTICGSPATALGRVDGGSFTLVDDAMFVMGWYSW
jgi:hypothetical protein